MIDWIFYPKSKRPPEIARKVISVFEDVADSIDSYSHDLGSNVVLRIVANGLEEIGFRVEKSGRIEDRIDVPVLFGQCGSIEKRFQADAYNEDEGFVVEVEAGRGVLNNQFLKDLFEACMMAEVRLLAIAVRNTYKNKKDFKEVKVFLETLYSSNRLQLPLDGVLVIGY